MSETNKSWFGLHSKHRGESTALLDHPEIVSSAQTSFSLARLESEHAAAEDARLLAEVQRVAQSASKGALDQRGNVAGFEGNHLLLLNSVNQIMQAASEKSIWFEAVLDAVPFPIHVIDLDMRWTHLNKGFEKLMLDNKCIRSREQAVGLPCSTATADICNTEKCGIRQLTKIGDPVSHFDWHGTKCKQDTAKIVNVRGEHIGWVELVQDQTPTIKLKDYTNESVNRLEANLVQLSQGNLNIDLAVADGDQYTVEARAQFQNINETMTQLKSAIQALATDAGALVDAAVQGKLSTRADSAKHQGAYKAIVDGVNHTLDAVIGPLNVSADYVARISAGDIPSKITDNYNGDFNKIKNNLNVCIDSINAMVTDAGTLAQAGVDGKLSTRADASKHQGDFRKIVEGLNATLESVAVPFGRAVEHLDKLSRGETPPTITSKYNGDVQKLADGFNSLFVTINRLVTDTGTLAQAGVDGKLSARADSSKHQGDFRKIVEGVNRTLDAVVTPIQEVGAVIAQLAAGDLTRQISRDYAGDFNQLKTAVNTLSIQFGAAIIQIGKETTSLVASSSQLNTVSQQMSASADETSTQANVVSAAAEQVSRNVQTVATGADEMGASIKEIAKSTAEATRVANMAVKTAGTTNQTIAKLGQSSAEIGQVIKVITSIAQQTNLLALNATIEAARAGEAGKGFAVVANEVKELAKETAKATEDISQKIEAIQGDTKGAVLAIGEISGIIAQISDIQNTIASAIEEQSATTNEIIRNLAEAAKGSTDISRNIGGVAEAARATSGGAAETQRSARSLERMSADLQTLIAQFKV